MTSPALDIPPRDRRDAALDLALKALWTIVTMGAAGNDSAQGLATIARRAVSDIIELRGRRTS